MSSGSPKRAPPLRTAAPRHRRVGPRVSELKTAQIGDLDEHRRAIRVRWTVEKRPLPGSGCPVTSSPRLLACCRNAKTATWRRRCSPGLDEAALRTAISRACKATGTPHFSPHGLRRRRGSLYYTHRFARRGGPASRRLERVAADNNVYALTDYREVDRTALRQAGRSSIPGRRCSIAIRISSFGLRISVRERWISRRITRRY